MKREWTGEQKRAIGLHGKNILVSAAAGSGKTAVLVERIIQMLTRPKDPVDVERLVVVTFTNAAAAEMKERISEALEELLESRPYDRYLQRQLGMLHIANITTIDSFCLNILRNNYMDTDLDPGFRIADTGELELLKADVMETMLEEYYSAKDPDFYALVDAYSGKKNDLAIEGLINDIYELARSYPWPQEWLDMSAAACRVESAEVFDKTVPGRYLYDHITGSLSSFRARLADMLDICRGPAGPDMYIDNLKDDLANLDMMLESGTFSQWCRIAPDVDFTDLSRKKGNGVDPELKELVKGVRTQYRDTFRKMREKLCECDVWGQTGGIRNSAAAVSMLTRIVKDYLQRCAQAKREKNIIDFNDIEQMTLCLLIRRDDGKITYTHLADELAKYYEEILIDEYQDSNYIQEQLLTAVSKSRSAGMDNNMFMVGDVKQSIYGFRLARPDLFIEKYDSYNGIPDCEMIELRKNFRSRSEVLDSVNVLFEKIMQRECGGIDYSDKVKLYPGLTHEMDVADEGTDHRTVIRLIDAGGLNSRSEETPRECEGREIARIVKEVTDENTGLLIFDGAAGGYRRARFGDIVVITRSVAGWAGTFANEMMNQGVPAVAQSSSGYYDTFEIEQVLNVLAVIDNPIQDIPLTAVVTSYFGTLDMGTLAGIRSEYKQGSIYEALVHYINIRKDRETSPEADAVANFFEWLSKYRSKAEYLPISELIWHLIYDSGFYDYVGTMPAGSLRQANLDMLCDKAKSYEKTSYHGLFNFLRYIDRVKRFDLEDPARITDSSMDYVQVMSIHKSKGLEFPVVIIAGMSKEFNKTDARGRIIADADIGIGADIIDPIRRTRMTTPAKTAVETKLLEDALAEEIRILYVAMTRAKEKLIMTGTVKNYERSSKKWSISDMSSLADLRNCNSYFDLVMPEALKDPVNFRIEFSKGDEGDSGEAAKSLPAHSDIKEAGVAETDGDGVRADDVPKKDKTDRSNEKKVLCGPYRYEYAVSMKTKMSVSEIKHYEYESQKQEEFVRETEPSLYEEEDLFEPTIPEFISKKQEIKGAERGTAYHRVMECLDYDRCHSPEDVREVLDDMAGRGLITARQRETVDPDRIYGFCSGELGQRAANAFRDKRLYREKPFVMGIEAGRIKCYQSLIDSGIAEASELNGETVLIQGVIDMFFEEGDELILVDYKTDRVSEEDGAGILKERYKAQLDYYAEALEKIFGKKVSEKIIYSFALDGCIFV